MEDAFPKYEDGPGPGRELSSPSAAPPQTCLTSVHGRAQHLCEKGRNRGTPSQRYHPTRQPASSRYTRYKDPLQTEAEGKNSPGGGQNPAGAEQPDTPLAPGDRSRCAASITGTAGPGRRPPAPSARIKGPCANGGAGLALPARTAAGRAQRRRAKRADSPPHTPTHPTAPAERRGIQRRSWGLISPRHAD